jgi:hypothetical protein
MQFKNQEGLKNMKTKILVIYIFLILVIPLLTITAIANKPPSAPDIEGPASGKAGVEIPYGFCSTDPDEDEISYCIDWGEGSGEICIGSFPSGTCANIAHTWENQGTYIIKAKAKDKIGAESPVSTLTVTMPKNLYVKIQFLEFMQNFLNSHPNMFPILQKLLNRIGQ